MRGQSRPGFSIESLERREFFDAGAIDTSFGSGGQQVVSFPEQFQLTSIYSSALQPDGKTVVVGSVEDGLGGSNFAVARLNANGTPDTTFHGGDGIFIQNAVGSSDAAFGVALQSDGKIVAVGSVTDEDGSNRFYVARLESDGTPDLTFGQGFGPGGYADPDLTPFPSFPFDEARSVVIQPDGKIVVSGSAGTGQQGKAAFAVVRFNTDGSLDQNFGFGGLSEQNLFGNDFESGLGVGLQSDGKIVVTGSSTEEIQFITFRLTSSGFLDSSFGDGGFVDSTFEITSGRFGTSLSLGLVVAIQPDQKVLVGGLVVDAYQDGGLDFDFGLVRYTADGRADPTFGGNFLQIDSGTVQTDFGNFESPTALRVAPNGKILMAGKATATTDGAFNIVEIARYNTDGSLDSTFSQDGKVILLPSGSPGVPSSPAAPTNFNKFQTQSAAIVVLVPGGGIFVLATQGRTLVETRLVGDAGSTGGTGDTGGTGNTGGTGGTDQGGGTATAPDLAISLGLPNPASIIAGRTGSVTVTITNRGTAAINASPALQVLFSNDAVVDAADIGLTLQNIAVSLAPGASTTTTVAFKVPAGAALGSKFLTARINGDHAVGEADFTNGDASAGLSVKKAPVVASATLKGPAKIARGKRADLMLTINNITQVVLVGTMALALKQIDPQHKSTDLTGANIVVNLKKKKNKAYKLSLTIPKTFKPGKYTFQVMADTSTLNPAGGLVTASAAFVAT